MSASFNLSGPALAPPPGLTSQFVNPPNDNSLGLGAFLLMLVVASIFFVVRVYGKIYIIKKIEVEDGKLSARRQSRNRRPPLGLIFVHQETAMLIQYLNSLDLPRICESSPALGGPWEESCGSLQLLMSGFFHARRSTLLLLFGRT